MVRWKHVNEHRIFGPGFCTFLCPPTSHPPHDIIASISSLSLPITKPASVLIAADTTPTLFVASYLLSRPIYSSLPGHRAQLQGNRISPIDRSSVVYRKIHKRSLGNGAKTSAKNPTRPKQLPDYTALYPRYSPQPSTSRGSRSPKSHRQQSYSIALCRVAEPIALTSIFPYSWVMVGDFKLGDKANASF